MQPLNHNRAVIRLVPALTIAFALALALATILILTGCSGNPGDAKDNVGSKGEEPVKPPTNRIDVSPAVRRNLGITFEKVERRHVASTLRAPGQFELLSSAKRNYHSQLAGRVQLHVQQYDRVEPGDLLARIDAPDWLVLQQKLNDTVNAIKQLDTRVKSLASRRAAIAKHEARLQEELTIWSDRVTQIEKLIEAGSGAAATLAEARSQRAATFTALAQVEEEQAEFEQQRVELTSQLTSHRQSTPLLYAEALGGNVQPNAAAIDLAMAQAASMSGLAVDALRKNTDPGDAYVPYWRTLHLIDIRAEREGIVEHIHVTNGQWTEAGAHFISTSDPTALRFRAIGLQSNLDRLEDGQPVRIIPPRGNSGGLSGSIEGVLMLGLEADPLKRKIDLLTTPKRETLTRWARAGVAAEMEIVTNQTASPQLAIPVAAVIQDGLEKVIFRRDPEKPDKVIRIEADLGLSDGRWIVVESGLLGTDEVVVGGVYELMLAGGGRAKGGHFHADGTWHADDH